MVKHAAHQGIKRNPLKNIYLRVLVRAAVVSMLHLFYVFLFSVFSDVFFYFIFVFVCKRGCSFQLFENEMRPQINYGEMLIKLADQLTSSVVGKIYFRNIQKNLPSLRHRFYQVLVDNILSSIGEVGASFFFIVLTTTNIYRYSKVNLTQKCEIGGNCLNRVMKY